MSDGAEILSFLPKTAVVLSFSASASDVSDQEGNLESVELEVGETTITVPDTDGTLDRLFNRGKIRVGEAVALKYSEVGGRNIITLRVP